MRTVSSLGVLGALLLWAVVAPAGAQTAAGQEGAAVAPDNPYTPPPCTGTVFADVTCSTPFDAWIEKFAADGITSGCGNGDYCPNANVTRAQMAVFVEKAMRGTSTWSPGDLGNGNTGIGKSSLLANTTGYYDSAVGYQSLAANTDGSGNTAVGWESLPVSSTASYNTAIGTESLLSLTTGNANTAVGEFGLATITTGYENTALGYDADVASSGLSNAMALGYQARADASNHVRIGNSTVTQIGGQVGWSNLSDMRAKTNIVPLDLGLDFVMALKPVSFTLKQGNGRTDMGFIAQDVETLLGDGYNVLGIGADKDRTLSLRYTDFIAPVVNAIQEQQAQIAARDQRIQNLESDVAALKAQVQALVAAQAGGTTKAAK
jgi:hypothetical protein